MKVIATIAASVLIGTTIALAAGFAAQGPTLEQPKIVGVLMYADWCSSCKVLEPKLNQVKPGFQGKPILFTRFDLTNDFTKDQSARYAALLGLEKLYKDNADKTGYMALIEWPSRRNVGMITMDKSPEEIKTMLSTLVN